MSSNPPVRETIYGSDKTTRRLIEAAAQNMKMTRALQTFVKYYKRHEREWDDEFLESDEFLDLRDAFDRACEALR